MIVPTLLPLLALPFPLQGADSRPASSPATRPAAHLISPEALSDHVRVLASDGLRGRRTATPAAKLAGDYIALQWESAGLAVPPGGGRFQDFPVTAGYEVAGTPRLSLGAGEDGGARSSPVPAGVFTALPHSGSGEVAGRAVFLGYGISLPGSHGGFEWDDYKGIEVKGKVAVLIEGSPDLGGVRLRGGVGRKIYTAKARGAVAVLLLVHGKKRDFASANDSAGIPAVQLPLSIAAKVWPRIEGLVRAYEGNEGKTGETLGGVELDLQVRKRRRTARNVLAWIPGSDPALSSEVVVLGAHYDHLGLGGPGSLEPGSGKGRIHNGADDNASGTSVLIEVGKYLNAHRDRIGRSVLLIAFSGEEEGLLGSRWFVDHPLLPLERVVAMINMDMVGRSKKNYVAAIGSGTSPAFAEFFDSHKGLGASVRRNQASFGGSDHQSFIQKGIPAVHFFTGTHADYHKTSDDADKVNEEGMARIADTVIALATWLSERRERPAFVKPKEVPKPKVTARKGARPYLGTIPDYVEGDDGVKLNGATAGSPAEKAGIRPGDVLIGLAGKKIDNIYDFSYIIQELRPGQRIKAVVRRDGKRVELDLVVGGR